MTNVALLVRNTDLELVRSVRLHAENNEALFGILRRVEFDRPVTLAVVDIDCCTDGLVGCE